MAIRVSTKYVIPIFIMSKTFFTEITFGRGMNKMIGNNSSKFAYLKFAESAIKKQLNSGLFLNNMPAASNKPNLIDNELMRSNSALKGTISVM